MTYGNIPADAKYIVGRPFLTTEGWCWPGEPVPEEVVTSANLYAFISSGMVYPYVPDTGYSYLPPHVYNAVKTYQEVHDIIARGEAPIDMDWEPPAKLVQAQEMADAEAASKKANQVISYTSSETWTKKLEESQASPRPIELPREQLFIDAKRDEAAEAGEEDEGVITFVATPTYGASEDEPLKPTFENSALQDKLDAATEAAVPSDTLVANTDPPQALVAAAEQADELNKTASDHDYSNWTKDQLQEEAKNRGVPTSGTKAEITSRLVEAGEQTPGPWADSSVDTPVEVKAEPEGDIKEAIENADPYDVEEQVGEVQQIEVEQVETNPESDSVIAEDEKDE